MTATGAREGGSGFRVLVVDDHRDAADSLSLMLTLWGYEVQVAYNGFTALEKASAFRPHCFFLDIGLPGLDGYSLARQIRAQPALNHARLVALSAYSLAEYRQPGGEDVFDYRLVKPADPDQVKELLIMLQEIMQVATETRELIQDARAELKEMKQEIREVREELREIKEVINSEQERIQEEADE